QAMQRQYDLFFEMPHQSLALKTLVLQRELKLEQHKTRTLQAQINTDDKTGLLKQPIFETEVKRDMEDALTLGGGTGIAYCDLDNFAVNINDKLGHIKGDSAIAKYAQ